MITQRQAIRGAASLAGGQVVTQGLSFVRNIIIARLISPEDLGIAATFAISVSLLEMISDVAADKLIVQAVDGDDVRLQRTAQMLLTLRGVFLGLLIYCIAMPAASLFGVPDAAWAFRWLAMIPILRGLVHLDIKRAQRRLQFGRFVAVEVASQLVATIVAWPLGVMIGDYAVVLWAMLLQVGVYALGSHLVGTRLYGWSWQPDRVRQLLSFGWPLLINGLLMYLILEGDRFILGAGDGLLGVSVYSKADLGIYSVAFMLTLVPVMAGSRVTSTLFLPILARVQESPARFTRQYRSCINVIVMMAAVNGIGFIIMGPAAIALLYGEVYSEAGRLVGWLAAMFTVRLLRIAPTLAALSRADTWNLTQGNVVRLGTLIGLVSVALLEADMIWFAVCGLAGELAAYVTQLALLRSRHGLSMTLTLRPIMSLVIGMLLAVIVAVTPMRESGWLGLSLAMLATIAVVVVLLTIFVPGFRSDMRRIVRWMYRTPAPVPV